MAGGPSILLRDVRFKWPGGRAFSLLEKLPAAVRNKMVLMHHEDDIEVHRQRAEAAGFKLGMPGDTWDLVRGTKIEHM